MNSFTAKIIAGGLFVTASILTFFLIKAIKKPGNEKKEKVLGAFIGLLGLGFVVLEFFVSPTIEKNEYNSFTSSIETKINTSIESVNSITEMVNDLRTNIGILESRIVNQHGYNTYIESYFAGYQADGITEATDGKEKQDETTIEDLYYQEKDSFITGWGDSSEEGRPGYTLQEINNGIIDGKIVFNSITDGKDMNEYYFVSARENNPDYYEEKRLWHTHLEAKKGRSYIIRLFAHNNNRFGTDATAEDVRVRFHIGPAVHVTADEVHDVEGFSSENGYWAVGVTGYISSSNADPKEYRYTMKFVSNKLFHLEYIPGSALFENNGIGAGGIRLPDSIVTDEGVMIGFDALDGEIPGCYKYSSYSIIRVYPVFE